MKNIIFLFLTLLVASCSPRVVFEESAGHLSMSIGKTGKLVSLKDTRTGVDYLAKQPSYLMQCCRYGTNDTLETPVAATCKDGKHVQLTYPNGIKLTVAIEPKENYFRMEVVKAEPVSEVSMVKWGPYYTNMQSFIGEWLGIVRSDDFSMGLLGLNPNTDGATSLSPVAKYTDEGALLQLYTFDHTRGVFRNYLEEGREDKLRRSTPINVTVEGSAIALYGSEQGYEKELDVIEQVELAEGLPHPTINGVWNKRSREQCKFCVWSHYNESNFKDYLDFASEMGAGILCLPHGYSKNWGHFDLSESICPSGISGLLNMSKQAQEKGIGTTLYTLTTFTRPRPEAEPYLAPVPDDRLQTWRYESKVNRPIAKGDKHIVIEHTPEVLATVKKTQRIRIDNELIKFNHFKEEGNQIVLTDCERGTFFTEDKAHLQGSTVKFMYFAGFNNYYPGTIDMTEEEASRLADIMIGSEQKMLVTDGFESCMECGYGCYAGNRFSDYFYKKCKEKNMEFAWTSSNFSNYSWHYQSHISWGEYDKDKGIRGSMLDYRISRQVLLRTSLMPKKLGQFYPNGASVADIEWLMAFSTGWDSGCDFSLNLESFKKNNPNYKEIVKKMALWTQAREEKVFTEKQLRDLRQADREYTLSKNEDGTWNLKFVKHWRSDYVKVRPSSHFPVKSLSGSPVKPCGIDWSWTHNPATYYEVMLTNDMIHESGDKASEWEVTYPKFVNPKGSWYQTDSRHFLFVLRVPEDAPCAMKDFVITYNGYTLKIPMTLKPGEYLTMPQLVPIVCVYNSKHELLEEKMIRGNIPFVQTGESAKISMSATPVNGEKSSRMIMNVRCQNGYFFP